VSRTAVLVGAAALALAGCSSSGSDHGAEPAPEITVSVSGCGTGWTGPHAGQQSFVLHDTDTRDGEVFLTEADTGAVLAYVDPIGYGTTATMRVDLGSGRYAFECAMTDEDVVTGPAVTVPGHAKGGAVAVRAVSEADLIGPTLQYERYVKTQLRGLAAAVTTLRSDVAGGRLAAARTDWLAAHLNYERLGAAYDAFGELDGKINGTAAGLPKGVDDPHFTGFHRIEYGLWHGETARGVLPYATTLVRDVAALRTQFARAQIDPLTVAIRAHEITENALQFELTGQTDYGSHSNLATVAANLEGTRVVLNLLRPLLVPRYPGLARTEQWLARTTKDVTAKVGTALSRLTRPQREQLDADVSQLAELLAPVATICEPRRTSA